MLEGLICDVEPQQVLCLVVSLSLFPGCWNPASFCRIGAEASLYARQRSRMTCVPYPHSAHERPGEGAKIPYLWRTEPSSQRIAPPCEQHNPAPIRQVTSASARKEMLVRLCNWLRY